MEQRTYIEDDSSHVKIENGTYQKERNPLLAVIFPWSWHVWHAITEGKSFFSALSQAACYLERVSKRYVRENHTSSKQLTHDPFPLRFPLHPVLFQPFSYPTYLHLPRANISKKTIVFPAQNVSCSSIHSAWTPSPFFLLRIFNSLFRYFRKWIR